MTSLVRAQPSDRRFLLNVILRTDFSSFVRAIFPIVSSGDTFLPNWHIKAMAHALDRVRRGECRRLIINVPPRSLKSICASVALPAFLLGHDPTRRIICVSYAENLSKKHASDFRAVVRSSLYRQLFPGTRISSTKDTELEVATTARGFRYATSTGGTLTGRGGNLLILDDPMKPQDAMSETARERLKQWYSNTLLTRLDNKATDGIIVVMQRLHVDDLVGHLLEQDGWETLILPAIAESEQAVPIGPSKIHHRRVGDLLHAEREPREVLDAIRHSMGSLDFAAQYQQQPVPPGGNLIKWAWFGTYDEPPVWASGDKVIVSWDTAMNAEQLSDFSVCCVLQVRKETVYVLDVIRARLEYPDLKRKIIETHKRWRPVTDNYSLVIENKGSGMSLIQDLKREGIHPIAAKPDKEKILRMNAHTARIESGCVHLPRRAAWLEEFRRELMAFPASKFDDQIDALSQALDRVFSRRGRIETVLVAGAY